MRDPRKGRLPAAASASASSPAPARDHTQVQEFRPQPPQRSQIQPLPFEPTPQNQQSLGSSLASYVLAGAGVAMGFMLVGAIFGGL